MRCIQCNFWSVFLELRRGKYEAITISLIGFENESTRLNNLIIVKQHRHRVAFRSGIWSGIGCTLVLGMIRARQCHE